MKAHIIKIAVHTVGRIGVSTALFFLIGIYLVFPASALFLDLQKDRKTGLEITATATRPVDIGKLREIKGIRRLSPVIKLKGTIAYGEYVLETEIEGIIGTYLEEENIDGVVFPDGSSMPYIILNEAALKAFKDSNDNSLYNEETNGHVILSFETDNPAVICGIIDDDEEEPEVYMNYDAAKLLGGLQGQYEIRLRLTSAGYGRDVIRELKAYGLEVQQEYGQMELWDVTKQKITQQCLSSLSFLVCAVLLTRKNYTLEKIQRCDEIKNLRLSGLSQKNLRLVFVLRLVIVLLLCVALACVAAWWTMTINALAVVSVFSTAAVCLLLFGLWPDTDH